MNLFVNVDNEKINFNVQYRKRRTASIQIDPTGSIMVIAPQSLSEERIKELVKSKSKWIFRKLEELKEIDYNPQRKSFEDGELFMYLGEKYPIKIEIDNRFKKPKIEICSEKIIIKASDNNYSLFKNAMEKWYREKCLIRIIQRVDYYRTFLGREPKNIRVKEQKRRWGTCTSEGNILLNWRIIMAPPDIIDYIVVHEMCHLIHMNHSKDYWKLVESILPDYKERREWLKKHGIFLDI